MNTFRYSIVLLVIILTCWMLASFNTPEQRYKTLTCHGRLIFAGNQDVDLAFVGTSLLANAAPSAKMQEKLAANGVPDSVVFNLARRWRGSGASYIMIRDFLSQHKVSTLAVEVNSTYEAERLFYHGDWETLAEYSDIIEDFSLRVDVDTHHRVQRLIRHLSKKVVDSWIGLVSGQLHQISESVTERQDCYGERLTRRERPKLMAKQKEDGQGWQTKPPLEIDFDSPLEARNSHYIKKIVDLASATGTKLVFIYLSQSYSPPLSKKTINHFEQKFGEKLISIQSNDLLTKLNESGYRDTKHVNDSIGLELLSTWFANKLVSIGAIE